MKNLLIIAFLLGAMSCQKAQRDEDTATNTAEDVSVAQAVFSDAYKIIRAVALETKGISSSSTTMASLFGCDDITVDTISNPKKITIDFKYIGCEGLNVARYGRLIGEFYGEFPLENSAVDLSFSNYYFQDYEANGKVRVIFKADNASGNAQHSFYVQSGKVTDDNSDILWTASHVWEVQENGNAETNFVIRGNSNGVNRKGNVFFSEIKSPIQSTSSCVYPVKGSRELEVINLSNRLAVYQSTSCKNEGVVIVNGSSVPFVY
ncbi:MAG: hypothetical protein RIC15_02245 [Vicingaceae bacterium]